MSKPVIFLKSIAKSPGILAGSFYALDYRSDINGLSYEVIDENNGNHSAGRYMFELEAGHSLKPMRYVFVKQDNSGIHTKLSLSDMESDDMVFIMNDNHAYPVDVRDVLCWDEYQSIIDESARIGIITPTKTDAHD